jgi:hypothetical protein
MGGGSGAHNAGKPNMKNKKNVMPNSENLAPTQVSKDLETVAVLFVE